MTSEDDSSLNEDEIDEIVNRVVDRLQDARAASDEDEPAESPEETAGSADVDEAVERAHEEARRARKRAHEEAERARERASGRRERAGSRERKADPEARLENLGERIERSVEASLHGLADDIERAFGVEPAGTKNGVTIGPEHTGEKAVYKTQLQKAGRVAVPDAEIEALGLEPGDTLQVVLYPVD